MGTHAIGFAVIYRWEIKEGREESFRQAWEMITLDIKEMRGGLGSRLHQADDGTWYAYAQWPSRETWANSQEHGSVNEEASALMAEAVEKSFDPIPLKPVRDLLD
jgi:heme-degrading monooxygenase HmoA